jgi:acetyl esterase/lipase
VLNWLRAERRRRFWLLPQKFGVQTSDAEYQPGYLARVYRPQEVAAFAAVLDVHGGNWTSGDRFQMEQLDRALAANGVLVAAIDYRLAPPDTYPASAQDVQLAARWLRARATQLGAAADAPTGAFGSSAGGHLVILAALQQPGSFDCVAADAPITDTSAYAECHPYWPTREASLDGSPLHAIAHAHAANLPPLLLTHGTRDGVVPIEMSRAFVARYRAAGGRADLQEFEGLDHAFILTHPRGRAARDLARVILGFFENQRP